MDAGEKGGAAALEKVIRMQGGATCLPLYDRNLHPNRACIFLPIAVDGPPGTPEHGEAR